MRRIPIHALMNWPCSLALSAICHGTLIYPAIAQQQAGQAELRKPTMADTVRINVYADNWFIRCINGELVAIDSIRFFPHNVVSVDILPQYPMTIAVMAKDNADPNTGMEYANTRIGNGGFILKFGDGTVTDET